MSLIGGIYPALITPFTKDNKINELSLRKLVRYNLEKKVSGFYVGGSTAEAFLLSIEERKRILEVVADEVNGKCEIISHIGAISTDEATQLGMHAKSLGVDAISAITPFYYNFSYEGIKNHYFEIANSVKLPFVIYNFPSLSGVELTPEKIKGLRENEYIIGVKHTSMNLFQVGQMKAKDKDLQIFNGHDEVFLPSLTMGCDGAIGSTYNFMAEKFIGIKEAFEMGDIKKAQAIQEEANEIIGGLIKSGVISGIKYILSKFDIDCGICRKPFGEISNDSKYLLDELAEKYLMKR